MHTISRCLLLVVVLLTSLSAADLPTDESAEAFRVKLEQSRSDIINRAPERDRELIKNDAKWAIITNLYVDAFKSVPHDIVNKELIAKAAVDAADLILENRAEMDNENHLAESAQRFLPVLQKRIIERPLDELTTKAALANVRKFATQVERALIEEMGKAHLDAHVEKLPEFVKARAIFFDFNETRGGPLLEWSTQQYVQECCRWAALHELMNAQRHVQNFWFGSAPALGFATAVLKSEEEVQAYAVKCLVKEKALWPARAEQAGGKSVARVTEGLRANICMAAWQIFDFAASKRYP